jgi:hypothetical protein
MGWFRNALNGEPAMMLSALLAGVAVAIPFVVVPLRRAAGKPTYQWDNDVVEHPVRAYMLLPTCCVQAVALAPACGILTIVIVFGRCSLVTSVVSAVPK